MRMYRYWMLAVIGSVLIQMPCFAQIRPISSFASSEGLSAAPVELLPRGTAIVSPTATQANFVQASAGEATTWLESPPVTTTVNETNIETEAWANSDLANHVVCDTEGCPTGCCETCEPCATGCSACPIWAHYTSVYGGLAYLRPRNSDVAYGVPIDGPITGTSFDSPIQVGGIGVVDPDYEAGFEFGLNLAVNMMGSINLNFLSIDTTTSNAIGTSSPDVVRSLVSHPSSTSAATDFLAARANLGLQMDVVDLGFRHLLVGGDIYAVNYYLGAKYGRFRENFDATFIDNGTETVATEVDFDGVGLRLGLDAERYACSCPLFIYGRSSASFLAGKFQADYFQGQSFDPTIVNTDWEAGRVVPVLDLELGTGVCLIDGCLRLSCGYVVSAWFNTVRTEEFISAVQQNDFGDLGQTLTLDGLVARAEWRF